VKLHSKRVEKMLQILKDISLIQLFTRDLKSYKNTKQEMLGKTTLETSGEDVKINSKRVERL
jgi:hypothetical protein